MSDFCTDTRIISLCVDAFETKSTEFSCASIVCDHTYSGLGRVILHIPRVLMTDCLILPTSSIPVLWGVYQVQY
jgi:hypothetical protein